MLKTEGVVRSKVEIQRPLYDDTIRSVIGNF